MKLNVIAENETINAKDVRKRKILEAVIRAVKVIKTQLGRDSNALDKDDASDIATVLSDFIHSTDFGTNDDQNYWRHEAAVDFLGRIMSGWGVAELFAESLKAAGFSVNDKSDEALLKAEEKFVKMFVRPPWWLPGLTEEQKQTLAYPVNPEKDKLSRKQREWAERQGIEYW